MIYLIISYRCYVFQSSKVSKFKDSKIRRLQDSKGSKNKLAKSFFGEIICSKHACEFVLVFWNNLADSDSQIRGPKGPKKPKIIKVNVFRTLVRQIRIQPVLCVAESCHLHFGNTFQYIRNKITQKALNENVIIFLQLPMISYCILFEDKSKQFTVKAQPVALSGALAMALDPCHSFAGIYKKIQNNSQFGHALRCIRRDKRFRCIILRIICFSID